MMISGRDWAANFGDVEVDFLEQLLLLGEAFVHELGLIAFPIALTVCCFSVFIAIKERHRVAQFAFAVGGSFLIGRCLLTIDRGNPDLMGYLLPGYLSIATGCLLTAKLYHQRFRRLGVFLGVVFLLATIGRLDFRPTESVARRYAEQLFSEVEPDGVLVTSLYSSWFWTWYLQGTLGHRPDVAVLFRGRMNSDWHRERLSKRFSSVLSMAPLGWLRQRVDHTRWEPGVEFRGLVNEFNLVPGGMTYHSGELASPKALDEAFRNVFRHQGGGDKSHEIYIRYEHLRSMANENLYRQFLPIHSDAFRPYEKLEPRLRELLEVDNHNIMLDQRE